MKIEGSHFLADALTKMRRKAQKAFAAAITKELKKVVRQEAEKDHPRARSQW